MKRNIKIITGFLLLFFLYHLAEYFVLFRYNPLAFLSVQAVFLIAAWFIARWQGFEGLSAWGFSFRGRWVKQLLTGVLIGLLLYGLTFFISLMIGVETVKNVPAWKDNFSGLALFGFGVFFSSVSEDILTRGYLFRHWAGRFPTVLFIFFSAAIYLLNHIYRLGNGWETWLYIFCLGVLFIIPLIFTKRLWLTSGMHWMGNTVFYFTHSIINTQQVKDQPSPNIILIFCILLFIPVTIAVSRSFSRKA